MRKVATGLAALEGVASAAAAAFLFVIMALVVADVFLRYVIGRPLTFTYDLVGQYLMVGLFFLMLSHAQAARAHVAVDILLPRFSVRARTLADLVTCLGGGTVFALITYVGFDRARDNYLSNDVLAGVIPWPTWVSTGMVPLGAGLLVIRFGLTAVGHLLALATGAEPVGLPPSTAEHVGETFE